MIKVMSAGAVQAMVASLGAEFEHATGHTLDLHFDTAGALCERLKRGERADLVILPPGIIKVLEKDDMFTAASRIDLGRTVSGVAIKVGSPRPDISTPATLTQTLLIARSVAYTDPQAGGSSGTYFVGLLERLEIAEEVKKKAVLGKRGHDVALSVAEGRAEIGITFISEFIPQPGIIVLGPLPEPLHHVNTYSAAIPASSVQNREAAALLRKLTDAATSSRWTAAGFEPAFL